MSQQESHTFTVEARLRACVTLAISLRETALQTRPYYSLDDSDPQSPSVLASLAPSFSTMIINHLQAVRFALSPTQALDWAPMPWTSTMRLVDIVIAVAGRMDEQRVLACADREARRLQSWRGLCWEHGSNSDEFIEGAVLRLTREIESDTPRYAQALDALARYGASGGDKPFEAALHARACETRAAYYLGLARGWYAAAGCWAGSR